MGKIIDRFGQRFGRLVVIAESPEKRNGKIHWLCLCDCGKTVSVQSQHLTSGHTKSCGCLAKDKFTKMLTTHGKSNDRIIKIWYGIRKRCYNPNFRFFKNYGGRGIVMCCEWKNDPQSFYEWAMSNGYADDLTIDRIDVNGNYCPENCRWITNQEQQNNRRSSHLLTYNGETHTMKDWAKITGIKYSTLRSRINAYKWDTARALTTATKEQGDKENG